MSQVTLKWALNVQQVIVNYKLHLDKESVCSVLSVDAAAEI